MANTQTAVQTAEELAAAQEEMRRLIFEAPIAELAEHQGITIDEAVALRVEQNLAAATIPIEVTVRPIEPQNKLIGFASVNFGGVVVDDFKVVNGQKGVYRKGTGTPRKQQAVRPQAAQGRGKGRAKVILTVVYHRQPNMERGLILCRQ